MHVTAYFKEGETEPVEVRIDGRYTYHIKGVLIPETPFIHIFSKYTDFVYKDFMSRRKTWFKDGGFEHACRIYDVSFLLKEIT